ncbi:aldehyde dehydrogenase family protein [Ancylobacter amanitiformis]|uniref:Acyl-CoA reductase-like NAD-dependent aldehyde dehydrogenase n=1 Tax=Ancylobacter amanitiformis TaxID=217069 RepID=A0ABU0LT36_9HYPH|nr:aldehyde dehydrogenase family protein [Ancylobacter amanitiformis]MDQ0511768.1 acyl-CoA reductase-like NAD-dependent aldehyde dehydrogenase [Ancylobacter amanitiformis]
MSTSANVLPAGVALADGIAEIRATGTLKGLPRDHFIAGRWTPPASGARMDSADPGRGAPFAAFANGDAQDVDRAVAAARAAFTGAWGEATPAERGRVLQRMASLLRAEADRFALVECLDSGKRLSEAQGDVRGVIRAFEYYAGAADKLEGASLPLGRNYLGFTLDEPVGVCAQVIPWNYPLSTAARGIAPALAAGCAIVAKPAEQTPFTALMLAELATRAGLPDGALNVVTGTGARAGAPLVAHPGIHHITFTGSVPTGIAVMQAAAQNVTRLVLELGGKSPLVVLADADLDIALEGVLEAIYENAGQICSAGSRLVLERSIADEFLCRLVTRVRALRLGHGLDGVDVGPVNSALQLARIDAHVRRAEAAGNAILAGGGIVHPAGAEGGWFFAPTIVAARGVEDPIVTEEIFGPVLAVQVVGDLDEAIHVANATEFALVAGIYTASFDKAQRFARRVDAGQVYINEYFAGGIEVPFGGNRKSGFGREKGMEGLRSYCRTKSIVARLR